MSVNGNSVHFTRSQDIITFCCHQRFDFESDFEAWYVKDKFWIFTSCLRDPHVRGGNKVVQRKLKPFYHCWQSFANVNASKSDLWPTSPNLPPGYHRDTFMAQIMLTAFTADHCSASEASENMWLSFTSRLLWQQTGGKVSLMGCGGQEIQLEMMHHQAEHMHTVDWLRTRPYTSTTIFLCTSRPPTIWQHTTKHY